MNRRGFTLIEVLVSLFVLSIGLAGAIAVIYGSVKAGVNASDQNIATILLPDAIEEITRIHSITKGSALAPADVGLFIETWDSAGDGSWPNIKNGPYKTATAGGLFQIGQYTPTIAAPLWSKMVFYPIEPNPKYYGGPPGQSLNNSSGPGYRVLYKLERHPSWVAGQMSFENMYVLTAAVYKDLNPNVHPANPKKRVEQISDPVVVYLRATRAQ